MSFTPDSHQYRCTIVRGKGQSEIEDYLPAYAKILSDICPCKVESFPSKFNKILSKSIPMAKEKTLSNHRTEIAGKLFGMYYLDKTFVRISERTKKLLEDSDLPSFFKDVCFKFQFPNGMDSPATLLERFEKNICLRPIVFILQAISYAHSKKNTLTRSELGYYALNCLPVLQGKVNHKIVVDKILDDRKKGRTKTLNSGSYSRQHITEIFNYIELANLIKIDKDAVYLNNSESRALEIFLAADYRNLPFNVYDYNLNNKDERAGLYSEWSIYYAKPSHKNWDIFETKASALTSEINFDGISMTDVAQIGDDGEKLVYQYEKKRIQAINSRWADKVKIVGGTRGLGYDVHSIRGEGDKPSRAVHIEVKSTKRKTIPENIADSLTLTRNEWQAAEQYGEDFWIYRVYLTANGVYVYPIRNVVGLAESGKIYAEPLQYRIDFKGSKKFLLRID